MTNTSRSNRSNQVSSNMLISNQAEHRKKGGREYLVVPGVPVQEQVMNSYLLPADEIQKYINAWNGTPVSIGHAQANNGSVKVPEPDVPIIGNFYNVSWDSENKRMLGEYWIDIQEAMRHNDGKLILDAIHNDKILETSTAYWADEEYTAGSFNGRDYKTVHRNTRPDHIAIFADGIAGACSIEDGCGVNRNMQHSEDCGCEHSVEQNSVLPPFKQGYLPTVILEKLAFDSGYRTPEQLEQTRAIVEKHGITKAVWLQRDSNGDYKILDGAHRVKLAHESNIEQIPVHVVDNALNELDTEAIYYEWEHDMDRSYLNGSRGDMFIKLKRKKRKFVHNGRTFHFTETVLQQGGKGSGHHGHRGRPGQEGGSSKGSGGALGGADYGDEEKIGGFEQEDWMTDIDMVGGHLDFRQLGEKGKFGVSRKFGVPAKGDDIDFYNENGDKLYGKVTNISGDKITIVAASESGRFNGKRYVLEMVDEKTGRPFS